MRPLWAWTHGPHSWSLPPPFAKCQVLRSYTQFYLVQLFPWGRLPWEISTLGFSGEDFAISYGAVKPGIWASTACLHQVRPPQTPTLWLCVSFGLSFDFRIGIPIFPTDVKPALSAGATCLGIWPSDWPSQHLPQESGGSHDPDTIIINHPVVYRILT